MSNIDNPKRRRSGDESPISLESKRMKAEEIKPEDLFDILDAEVDAVDDDVADVMRSLEAEITAVEQPAVEQPDLGFLFGASDDELGLPPPAPAPAPALAGAPELGEIWGFEDGFEGFDAVAAGGGGGDGEEVVEIDGGLFDFGAAAEFADVAWRTESLPAVKS